jgi:histidinol-phosphatase (PHP family)
MIDYHTHTPLCNHATGSRAEYLAAAEAAGLAEIGVSDHTPWPKGYDTRWRMKPEEFPIYKELIDEMRAIKSDVKVKYALEADWVPGKMDEVFQNMANEPFDYVIGSIHYTDELPFDNPDTRKAVWEVEGRAEWIWHRYYELMLEMVTAGCFNIIGHFDLPKKFGNLSHDTEEKATVINDILTAAEASGMAIEINTAGLRKPVKEIYPQFEILKNAATHGVMLTFGSDAHAPSEVAANFAEAIVLAKEAGFSEYVSFDQRTSITHKLI